MSLQITGFLCGEKDYEANINFKVHKQGKPDFISTFSNNETLLTNCYPNEPYTIIVHGWRETVEAPWAPLMISGFQTARGGCVVWMDYS